MRWGDNDLVRTWPDGRMTWHRGATSDSQMSRQRWPDGREAYYQGAWGEERVSLMIYPCGKKECYSGERGHERLGEAYHPNGFVYEYRGPKGAEYVCRAYHMDHEPLRVNLGELLTHVARRAKRTQFARLADWVDHFYDEDPGMFWSLSRALQAAYFEAYE